MAKIRGVKPEFWTDDKVVELSRDARLLFIGLWNFACDNGHLDDKPKQIKMRIFPADGDVDVDALLDEISAQGFLKRADGVVTINRFAHHQKPHRRWWHTCDLPGCEPPDGATTHPPNRGETVVQPLQNGVPTADGDGDGDGDGDSRASRGALELNRRRPETPLPDTWQPTEKHRALAAEKRANLSDEVFRFRNHAHANDRRQRNWDAAFNNWLSRAKPAAAVVHPGIPEGW